MGTAMLQPWAWLILPLAATRATRLVVEDEILDRPRRWLMRSGPTGWVAKLVTCPACVSVWAAAALVLGWLWAPTRGFTLTVATTLAVALVVPVVNAGVSLVLRLARPSGAGVLAPEGEPAADVPDQVTVALAGADTETFTEAG